MVGIGTTIAAWAAAAPAQTIPGAASAATDESMRRAAATMLETYSDPDRATDLAGRFQLQVAAGRYREADSTLGELVAVRRRVEPERIPRLVGWRIYARARILAGEGQDKASAVRLAFEQIYASLPDKEAVEAYPLLQVSIDRARGDFNAALVRCRGQALEICPARLEVIADFAFLRAWTFLLPDVTGLLEADSNRRFIIDRRLVATPDGARLDTMVVRPRSRPGRLTALLEFTIYADDQVSFARAAKMAAHGYAGVEAYSRGKGRSPGAIVPYRHDGADAKAVIDWVARQRWNDGRVGMFSGSYNAFTQWAAVKHVPRALKAIATNASNAPGIDTPMERNVFQSFIYPWPFYVADGKYLDDKVYQDQARWAALNRRYYLEGRPYRDLPRIDGTPNPIFSEWLRHPDYDGWWRRLIPYGREFARIRIPVLTVTGYFDGGQVGALYYLRQHYRNDRQADHRLLIGPYHHIAMQTGVLRAIGGYDIDEAAAIDLQDVRLKWFDHIFRGAPMPDILKGRVNFEVMGANRWRHVQSLSAMGNGRLRLYLSDKKSRDRYRLTESRPGRSSSVSLEVDLADRADVDYQPPGLVLGTGLDTRNALLFETAPIPRALEVNGSFFGHLRVTTNKKDFDLSVVLYERLKDGRYFRLASFIGRASNMASRSRRRLLVPGRPRLLAFDSDRITARLIGAGSRIIAVVGIVKRPDAEINYGTGRNVADESIADAGPPMEIDWSTDSFLDLRVWR